MEFEFYLDHSGRELGLMLNSDAYVSIKANGFWAVQAALAIAQQRM